jgi:hypothetical protein
MVDESLTSGTAYWEASKASDKKNNKIIKRKRES